MVTVEGRLSGGGLKVAWKSDDKSLEPLINPIALIYFPASLIAELTLKRKNYKIKSTT